MEKLNALRLVYRGGPGRHREPGGRFGGTGRLAVAAGRLTDPLDDHVIVVGLGNVGTRVVQELHSFGVTVVAVDRAPTARGVAVARAGRAVLIGEATSPETLRERVWARRGWWCCAPTTCEAGDRTARSLLTGRNGAAAVTLRVVLRLFDEGYASRVQRDIGMNTREASRLWPHRCSPWP